MKKSFINISLYAALVCILAMGFAFSACSDDDDNGGTGSGNLPTISGDPVVSITNAYGEVSTFNYSDGVMTDGFTMCDDMEFVINRSPFEIVCHREEEDGETYEEKYTNIRTNSFGAITSADYGFKETGYGEVFEGNGSFTIEYNADNRLQRLEHSVRAKEEGYEYSSRMTIECTWEGGRLMNIEIVDLEENYGEEYDEDYSVSFTYDDDVVSNSGIHIPEFIVTLDFMNYAGLFGRPADEIPSSYTEYRRTYAYSVDKDEKGRITALYRDGNLRESYGYADTQTKAVVSPMRANPAGQTHRRGLLGMWRKTLKK